MKKQNLIEYLIVFILGLLILNLMVYYYTKCLEACRNCSFDIASSLTFSFLAVNFGILIEWQKVKGIFSRKLSVNWLLLPSLILLTVSFIPTIYYLYFFGLGTPYGIAALGWIIDPLQNTITRTPINILSGILIIRSLTDS